MKNINHFTQKIYCQYTQFINVGCSKERSTHYNQFIGLQKSLELFNTIDEFIPTSDKKIM